MAMGDYIDKHNDNPKPFVWTAKASDILEKVKRARAVLDNRLICLPQTTSKRVGRDLRRRMNIELPQIYFR